MTALPKLEDFPAQTHDKLRYGDTDRQGHVNNAVFATFLETGRVALLDGTDILRRHPDVHFVIARLVLDYRAEIFWPGTVEIGTGVKSIGNSSTTFVQALFQNGKCVATAETVLVQVSRQTGQSTPMTAETKNFLKGFLQPA
ncbi:MAG: thioesterase family protein [Acidocella sp.]|nr:thioesterase family protein [Acidocella sp.]